MKNNISAVVNCYNEEEYIYYSLKSVYPFVEQIVIVDNCSTDSTRELIKKFIFNEDVEGKVKTHFVKSPMQLADAIRFYDKDRLQLVEQAFDEVFCSAESFISKNELTAINVHLFLSMLPLHHDRPERQLAMVMNAKRLYKKLNSVSPL
jgi:glycosyltransferase involved in cell wall biosynthesis